MVAIHFIAYSAVEFLIIYANIVAQMTLIFSGQIFCYEDAGETKPHKLNYGIFKVLRASLAKNRILAFIMIQRLKIFIIHVN